jgi:hypothetical protein
MSLTTSWTGFAACPAHENLRGALKGNVLSIQSDNGSTMVSTSQYQLKKGVWHQHETDLKQAVL